MEVSLRHRFQNYTEALSLLATEYQGLFFPKVKSLELHFQFPTTFVTVMSFYAK
jgi:hypothetical protein